MPQDRIAHQRVRLLAMIIILIMAIFVVRLFYLQVIRHSYYVAQADSEQLKRLTIPAKRGELYMMDGTTPAKVVLNQTVYTMFVDPNIIDKPTEVKSAIREVVGGNAVDGFSGLVDKKKTRYQIVAHKVTRTQAELIRKRKLSGIGFQAVTQRVYPEANLGSQTLGFVNASGDGQYGVEGYFNDQLKGKDGLLQSVTDVANVPLTIGKDNINQPAVNGRNVVLSIDRNAQAYTERALANGMKKAGASNGSAIVMDPQTGKVVAMVSLPTYDPSKLSEVQNISDLNNATVSVPYEPGSVMKTFTMATGIDTGKVTPDSTFVNTDSVKVDDRTISNATKGRTGTITLQTALNYSLNTGMVHVLSQLGGGSINSAARTTLYDYLYNRFKLGQKTGIEVAGESQGIVIPPTDSEGNAVRYSNMSFGQGMNLTMVQVASGFSAIVNGGTYYHPTVVAGEMADGKMKKAIQKPAEAQIISAATSEQMRKMVVTARQTVNKGIDRPGYMVGGKTGTSQTLVNGSYDNGQTVGTYLGFGGDSAPRYVIMVQVSGKGINLAGGQDAMPIFTDISNWMIDYLKLQPQGNQ